MKTSIKNLKRIIIQEATGAPPESQFANPAYPDSARIRARQARADLAGADAPGGDPRFDPGEFSPRHGDQMQQFMNGIMGDLRSGPGISDEWLQAKADDTWRQAIAELERQGKVVLAGGRWIAS